MNRLLLASVLGTCALSTWALLPSPTARAAAADVSLSIADARLVEPPTGQKSMIFQVRLSQPWPSNVDIYYSTSKGPNASTAAANTLATPNVDFTSLRDVVTIPAGSTLAQIEVPVLADTAVEQDETFAVNINQLAFATFPPVTAEPTATSTPVPTATPTTEAPEATAVPTATVNPTATPIPTATSVPVPTATPAPTIKIAT